MNENAGLITQTFLPTKDLHLVKRGNDFCMEKLGQIILGEIPNMDSQEKKFFNFLV